MLTLEDREKKQTTHNGQPHTLQRKFTQEHVGGFVENRPKPVVQRRENNTGLPDNLKQGVESLAGIDISHVRVHRNSPKPATLNAHAYTQGSHIYLAPGQEKHIAHEAWHVVQQNQGRVPATQQIAGLPINDQPRLEKEADSMGSKAANPGNHHPGALYANPVLSTPTPLQLQVIQRLAVGERPFEEGYQVLTNSSRWFLFAENYERSLGSYTYNHPISKEALDSAIKRMYEVFKTVYQEKATDEEYIKEIFFRDIPESAGQVGLDLDLPKMLETLFQGNLREKMTAFYNASYFEAGPIEHLNKGFSAILNHIVESEDWGLSEELDLKTNEIKKQSASLKGLTRGVLSSFVNRFARDKKHILDKDIFALGNLALQSEHSLDDSNELFASQKGRENRDAVDKLTHQKTAYDYEAMDAPLSQRELAYVRKYLASGDIDNDKLPWEEGVAVHKITPTEAWYKKIHDKMKMPVTDGLSGTTTRLLSSFIWLNTGKTPINFRLAIMGWMLTSNDHSLYEIMRGSHIAGVKAPGEEENIKDVHRMYMNVAPLKTDELREHVAEDKLFPHELLYKKQTLETDESKEHLKAPTPKVALKGANALFDIKNNGGDDRYNKLSAAHAIAIAGYTGRGHSLINAMMESRKTPEIIVKQILKSKLMEVVDYYYYKKKSEKPEFIEVLNLYKGRIKSLEVIGRKQTKDDLYKEIELWIDNLTDILYPELKAHANMAVEGLSLIPSEPSGTVYRGDWEPAVSHKYREGAVITYDTFTSFSRDQKTAREFMQEGTFSHPVIIRLFLHGIGAKDVSPLARFGGEAEVLLMPGSKIRVEEVTRPDGKEKRVTATEIR